MDDQSLAAALVDLARRLGIEVRIERLDAAEGRLSGGFCVVHGAPMILVDEAATPAERVAVLATALCRTDTDTVFVAPAVRECLNRARARGVQ